MEQKEEFKVMQIHDNYQAVQENQKQRDAKNKVKVPLNPETCEIPKMVFIMLFYTPLWVKTNPAWKLKKALHYIVLERIGERLMTTT